MSEIWNLSTLCRCCHADGNFKSLNSSYQGKNDIEIYETMLRETLGIVISTQPVPLEASYTICDRCIFKLRDATEFKNQVMLCEEKFKFYCNNEQFINTCDIKSEGENEDSDICNDEMDENQTLDVKKDEMDENQTLDVKKESNIEVDIKYPIKEVKEGKRRVDLDRSLIIQVDTDTGTQFSCKDCGGLYQTEKDLNKHIYKAHATLFKCQYCPRQLKSFETLKKHLKLHTEKEFNCSFCPKKFASKHALKNHLNCHNKEKIYKCNLCGKGLKYRQTLIRHLRVHAGTNKKILCDLCGRSFNDQSNLNAHIRTVHEKLRPFHCKICQKSYTNKRHLKDHLKLHNGDEKLYKCDVCDQRLSCAKTLKMHRVKHENKFMCRYCSKIFDDAGSRREHINAIHNKDSPWFSCPLCGKVFSGKFSLNRHIDEHKGIMKFPCDLCGLKFTQKVVLNRHIFRKHKPEADIDIGKTKCDICKRSFKNIVLHMEKHKNRLCACEICEKTYPNTSALNRHKSLKHFGKTFDCDICEKKYLKKSTLNAHRMKVHQIKTEKDCEEGT